MSRRQSSCFPCFPFSSTRATVPRTRTPEEQPPRRSSLPPATSPSSTQPPSLPPPATSSSTQPPLLPPPATSSSSQPSLPPLTSSSSPPSLPSLPPLASSSSHPSPPSHPPLTFSPSSPSIPQLASSSSRPATWEAIPDEVWEHAFPFLPADADHGAAAAVCQRWLQVEHGSRRRLTIHNCYATTPMNVVERFSSIRAIEVKGKPHWADFGVLPANWGAYAMPWVEAAAQAWPLLEELNFKRMVVIDDCLQMIASSLKNLRVLRMNRCDGFTAAGLAAIARGCRDLKELDVEECSKDVVFAGPCWLREFPDAFASLDTLNFWSLRWEVDLTALESLVRRCRNLKTLKLHNAIPLDNLASILQSAPQITQLGTGNFSNNYQPDIFDRLQSAFGGCQSLRRISGAWGGANAPAYLPALYCVCEGLTSLNLFSSTVRGPGLLAFISRCKNLVHLWVMDLIDNDGMSVVASTCSKLQELRVVPSHFFNVVYQGPKPRLTERGLVEVSANCPMLQTILFFCSWITNEALITVARNLPNLTSFRFALINHDHLVDYVTRQPLDAGFSAIVQSCRGLRRLSISGHLTDAGLRAIDIHASRLEVLSLAWTGDGASDLGLHCILSGCCNRLRRLQAMQCKFGDIALQANAAKLETMQYVWLLQCKVTVAACRLLALRMPRLTVEMIGRSEPAELLPPDNLVKMLYVYRTLVRTRTDAPPESVQIC